MSENKQSFGIKSYCKIMISDEEFIIPSADACLASAGEFIRAHNSNCARNKRITISHTTTVSRLVVLFLKEIIKRGTSIYYSNLPGFYVGNNGMAKTGNCQVRTFQNHKARLIESQVILNLEYGGKMGVKIFLNPVVLFGKHPSSADAQQIKDLSPDVKNFHPLVLVQQVHNNFNSNVDNSNLNALFKMFPGKNTQEQQGHHKDIQKQICIEENVHVKSPEELVVPVQPKPEVRGNSDGDAFFSQLLKQFFKVMNKAFYRGHHFSILEEQHISELIKDCVYDGFDSNRTQLELNNIHEAALRRIRMVEKYIDKDPTNRFIPSPEIYFDKKNASGFIATEEWNLRDMTTRLLYKNKISQLSIDNKKPNGIKKKKLYTELIKLVREMDIKKVYKTYLNAIDKYKKLKELGYEK